MEELFGNPPPIPPIHDQELYSAVSALAHAGSIYKKVYLSVLAGQEVHKVTAENVNLLLNAEKVLDVWIDKFESENNIKNN